MPTSDVYHHLTAVIMAAIAATASTTSVAISKAVAFFFKNIHKNE